MNNRVLMNGKITTRKQRAITELQIALVSACGMVALFLIWWFR